MTTPYQKYAADFNAMTDRQIERECDVGRGYIEEHQDWLEAVADWDAAGRPRGVGMPDRPPDIAFRAHPSRLEHMFVHHPEWAEYIHGEGPDPNTTQGRRRWRIWIWKVQNNA